MGLEMTTRNQRRWKSIRSMARRGPAEAMSIWLGRKRWMDAMVACDATGALIAHFNGMLSDAAAGVKLSKPVRSLNAENDLADPDSGINRFVRSVMVSKGYEMTPMCVVNERAKIFAQLRECIKDVPVPDDDQAMLEWWWFMQPPKAKQ